MSAQHWKNCQLAKLRAMDRDSRRNGGSMDVCMDRFDYRDSQGV
jgi:hypothetical protein